MTDPALCRRLEEATTGLLERLPPGNAHDVVGRIRAGLDGPLRVAVVGRVNSGKSTLVNALLAQRVAATDVSECTRFVTTYHHGVPERVEVERSDGSRDAHALTPDGALPDDLPLGPDARALHVHLPNDALRQLTLVDTPGLASASERAGATTSDVLALDRASVGAVRDADAVLHVMAMGIHRDELDLLEGFRTLLGGVRLSPANAVVVLNKCDLLAGHDPLAAGSDLADRHADLLRSVALDVVPTVGLLSETADAGGLSGADVEALRALATLPPAVLDVALLSVDRFTTAALAAPPEARARLLARLDRHGVRVAVDALREPDLGAEALLERLRAASGLPRLRGLLAEVFTVRADALKADTAVTELEQLARHLDDPAERSLVLDLAEEVRLDPGMHRLAEVRALRACTAGVRLPEPLADDLRRLVTSTTLTARLGVDADADAAKRQRAAVDGARRWKAFLNDARTSPDQRAVALVVSRSYDLLWLQSEEAG